MREPVVGQPRAAALELPHHVERPALVRRPHARQLAFARAAAHGVDRRLAQRVGRGAVDVREVLARERPAADRHARPVEVDRELAPGLAVVAVAAAVHQRAVRVHQQLDVAPLRRPARVARLQRRPGLAQLRGNRRRHVRDAGAFLLLHRDQHVLQHPRVGVLAQAHDQLAVGSLAREPPAREAPGQRLAEHVRQVVLRRQPRHFLVVARPAHRDALVVHVARPLRGVAAQVADAAVDGVAAGVDRVAGHVAELAPGAAHDVGERLGERARRRDAAGQEHLVAPAAHLDLAVAGGVGRVAGRDDRIGHLVAELVGVPRQHHLRNPDHGCRLTVWLAGGAVSRRRHGCDGLP